MTTKPSTEYHLNLELAIGPQHLVVPAKVVEIKVEQTMSDLATKLNEQLYYQSPEELARIAEFNRTYVPPVLSPEKQLWADWREGKLELTALTSEQMQQLLTQAHQQLDEYDQHDCW
jgi:hypothetical protein